MRNQCNVSEICELFGVEKTSEGMSHELWDMYQVAVNLDLRGNVSNEFYNSDHCPVAGKLESIEIWISNDEEVIGEIIVTPKSLNLFYY